MQYILTEQEYRALTPISEVDKLKEEVQLLNDKVMELRWMLKPALKLTYLRLDGRKFTNN